ncbi:MAG: 4Fe-4S dicluster domain-containing protein [Planctomycetia bacterium]|nr:4Fe-4S dicluster domain-containing protein [Planctomycetia bacterium]
MFLRICRRVLALLFFLVFLFYFLDFAEILPHETSLFMTWQLVPAWMEKNVAVLATLGIVTLLAGRIYCSTICPLGILQDGIAWVARRFQKKPAYRYESPQTAMRWGIVGVVVFALALGVTAVLSLLDPYSAFGRVATNVFRPVYLTGNNLLAWIGTQNNNYTFYYVNAAVQTLVAFFVALATLLVVGILAYRNGRTYCNTICPVGTILGLLSRWSWLRVRISPERCVGCGMCAKKCKGGCIDPKAKTVDNSRCVDCFNCLGTCKFQALTFGIGGNAGIGKSLEPSEKVAQKEDEGTTSRRDFLSFLLLAAATGGSTSRETLELVYTGKLPFTRQFPIAPPGAKSIAHLIQHCTACHLCVAKCPVQILKPAVGEYGLEGFLAPRMDFTRGFCNFDCTICSEICPNDAIDILTMAQKHLTQVGKVVFIEDNCVVKVDETNCGACSEHCPTQAVQMVPYKGSLTIPKIDPTICVGCGGCEHICPVRPYRAIYVEGNEVHVERAEFEESEKIEVQLDDFGF